MLKRILVFGDSNTYGLDPRTGARYGREVRYTARLQALLGQEYFVMADGLPGRTIAQDDPVLERTNGLAVLPEHMRRRAPLDTLAVMLGTNDARSLYGLTPERIAADLERLLRAALAQPAWRDRPDILVIAPHPVEPWYVDGPFYPMAGRGCVERTLPLPGLYRRVAGKLGLRFYDAGAADLISREDGLHLSPQGHAALADALLPLLR